MGNCLLNLSIAEYSRISDDGYEILLCNSNINKIKVKLDYSQWLPMNSDINSQYNPPVLNATVGLLKSLSNPSVWSANQQFKFVPLFIPTVRDTLMNHSSVPMSVFTDTTIFDEILKDKNKYYVSVDNCQLSPDLLEYYHSHVLLVSL